MSTEYQCKRCGSSVVWEDCHECGDEDDESPCSWCEGTGGWWMCVSSAEWCEAHPAPGCEAVKRGEIEGFEVQDGP